MDIGSMLDVWLDSEYAMLDVWLGSENIQKHFCKKPYLILN